MGWHAVKINQSIHQISKMPCYFSMVCRKGNQSIVEQRLTFLSKKLLQWVWFSLCTSRIFYLIQINCTLFNRFLTEWIFLWTLVRLTLINAHIASDVYIYIFIYIYIYIYIYIEREREREIVTVLNAVRKLLEVSKLLGELVLFKISHKGIPNKTNLR